jgi:transposase-like protein
MKTKRAILRQGRDKWPEIISAQNTGGLSVSAYCRQQGINEKTFYNWRKKLGNSQETKPKRFIQIKAMESGSGKVLRIQTPGGYRLEVESGVEKSHVQSILEVLAGL